MENTNHTGEDAVTISAALKRLENQAPARQSFYAAVNKGKIREISNKENNPDGKRLVSWASVLDYIAGGGFKSRQKSEPSDDNPTETTLSAVVQGALDSRTDCVTEVSDAVELSMKVTSLDAEAVNGRGDTRTQTQPAPRREQAQGDGRSKRNSATTRERANPKPDKKATSGENLKGRRSLPLRTIKNNLRHLDYEQTKALRDWADNRLLTVLRPEWSVASNDSENQAPQPN